METLIVPSIHCDSCETYIKTLLSPLSLETLNVDHDKHTVSYSIPDNLGATSRESLLRTVQRTLYGAGYGAEDINNEPGVRSYGDRVYDFFFGGWQARRRRHLRHCYACQLGSSEELQDIVPSTPTLLNVLVDKPSNAQAQETHLSIEGMTCSACTSTVSRILSETPGVSNVVVDLLTNCATILHNPAGVQAETLISEIEDAGFGATVIDTHMIGAFPVRQTRFSIQGMTCSACTGAIYEAVKSLSGIKSVSISLITNSMDATYDPSALTPLAIVNTVTDLGYDVLKWDHIEAKQQYQTTRDDRTIELNIEGMVSGDCPVRINACLESLDLISFTPVSIDFGRTKIHYKPSSTLTIRHIILELEPFKATIYVPPSLMACARKVQEKETAHLTHLSLISFAFAIPTFVIGVLAMDFLPDHNWFRMWWETPLWGGATRAAIWLWIMATFVQFGVGRIFYKRAYKGTFASRKRPWKWSRLIHFGNMDLLVALSTSVAYIASIGIMVRAVVQGAETTRKLGSETTYFDSCVFIIFFVLMGRVLEGRAKVKTGDAIALLGDMRPHHASLVCGIIESYTGKEGAEDKEEGLLHRSTTSIPVENIELGDYILIQPGDVPPADGIIVSGSTSIDESSLTGESLPVFKGKDDTVMTGTTNLTSPVVIRVIEVGDQTMLYKIVQTVVEGQSRKAPIERLADSITAVFVPMIIWFSTIVLIIWLSLSLTNVIPISYLPYDHTKVGDRVFFAFEFAISCLVIACPCGIGLAAPTAQAVGSGLAAKAGILAQGGGEAFQMAANVDTVVFDKTGTLTTGNMIVSHLNKTRDVPDWLFHAVRLMENGSSHPLALAITEFCFHTFGENGHVSVESTEEVPGKGLKATIRLADGSRYLVLVGNEKFVVIENFARLEVEHFSLVCSQRALGRTVVFVATLELGQDEMVEVEVAPTIMASFSVSDTIRPPARATVEQLRDSGHEVFMLTGDNETTARAVAAELGIEPANVVAGVLPQEKAGFINILKERRKIEKPWYALNATQRRSIVAFCGDGFNDTAALTAADVGVALAQGSQVTISAASFVLLSQTSIPTSVFTLLQLSRKVYSRQKMNFGWAMAYNIVLLPVAAGALYAYHHTRLPPVWSALAMALSSVSVVTSSLALQWGW